MAKRSIWLVKCSNICFAVHKESGKKHWLKSVRKLWRKSELVKGGKYSKGGIYMWQEGFAGQRIIEMIQFRIKTGWLDDYER